MSRAKANLVSLRYLPSQIIVVLLVEPVDFHIETEHEDLLALVFLHHLKILLLQQHYLFVQEESKVV